MEVIIKRVENGWTVKDVSIDKEYVYAIEDSEVQSFKEVLYDLDDIIGPTTSRYSKERIYIEIRQGDKHEDHG